MKNWKILSAVSAAVLVLIGLFVWQWASTPEAALAPAESDGAQVGVGDTIVVPIETDKKQTAGSATARVVVPSSIELTGGDTVASWNFKGAYTGNTELEAKADADIARLTGLLGSGQYSNYILYVSMANQYDLKGDGKNELAYLRKAITEDPATGLAWNNVGQLFVRLGAYTTARVAFERAVAVQPIEQYKRALADFMALYFPRDAAAL